MRWRGQRQSGNIEDRRGMAAPRAAGASGGLLRLLPVAYRFLGFKGTAIAVVVIGAYVLFTGNLGILTGSGGLTGQGEPAQSELVVESAEEQELVDFVSTVLADTEESWHELFRQAGGTYQEPTLVLFRGAVSSACGLGQAAMGPFYCPSDHKVYIDLSFYSDLKHRYKAPGDFAQAYVIAHEIGHHVQNLLGIMQKVHDARPRVSETEANQLSVRLELQADCFAGVWAHHAHHSRQLLEEGDVEEGLAAASAIGDDRLQKQSQGYVSPDSFTHGSSAQRVKWFRTGLERGEMSTCDTFSVAAH
jgi:hypothetical protein